MVHEAQNEATSVLLFTVKDTISMVLSRVLQVIESVIQTMNSSTGTATQSYTILLGAACACDPGLGRPGD